METYFWCAVGIVISVLLPILWEAVHRSFPKPAPRDLGAGAPEVLEKFWNVVKPYVWLGIASLLTAILIVAFMGETLKDYRAALLAGYAWDSTLQKLRK